MLLRKPLDIGKALSGHSVDVYGLWLHSEWTLGGRQWTLAGHWVDTRWTLVGHELDSELTIVRHSLGVTWTLVGR